MHKKELISLVQKYKDDDFSFIVVPDTYFSIFSH